MSTALLAPYLIACVLAAFAALVAFVNLTDPLDKPREYGRRNRRAR